MDFISSYRVFTGFHWVLACLSDFFLGFTVFLAIAMVFNGFLLGFTGFYRVLLGYSTISFWVLLFFSEFRWFSIG